MTPAKPTSRERLLDTAAKLFYRDGIGTGVEALCRAAGVSKRSMYQQFDSKEEVVAASLERAAPAFQALVLPGPQTPTCPRERVLHVFLRLETIAARPDYRGCPFVATAIELKDPEHPASLIARKFKQAMTDFFRDEVARGGARDPETLARQLTIVFDGASARVVVHAETLAGLAVATATALLDAAGVRSGS